MISNTPRVFKSHGVDPKIRARRKFAETVRANRSALIRQLRQDAKSQHSSNKLTVSSDIIRGIYGEQDALEYGEMDVDEQLKIMEEILNENLRDHEYDPFDDEMHMLQLHTEDYCQWEQVSHAQQAAVICPICRGGYLVCDNPNIFCQTIQCPFKLTEPLIIYSNQQTLQQNNSNMDCSTDMDFSTDVPSKSIGLVAFQNILSSAIEMHRMQQNCSILPDFYLTKTHDGRTSMVLICSCNPSFVEDVLVEENFTM